MRRQKQKPGLARRFAQARKGTECRDQSSCKAGDSPNKITRSDLYDPQEDGIARSFVTGGARLTRRAACVRCSRQLLPRDKLRTEKPSQSPEAIKVQQESGEEERCPQDKGARERHTKHHEQGPQPEHSPRVSDE
jgi:hypothetical protein